MPKKKLLLSNVFIGRLSVEDRNLLARKNINLGCVCIFFPILGVLIGTLIAGIKGIYAILFFSPIVVGGIWIVIYHFGLLHGIFLAPKNQKMWVAKYKGEIIGSVDVRCKEQYSILEIIWVQPVFQRMGIGSALINEVIQELTTPLYVQAAPGTKNFYRNLGFTKLSRKHRQKLPIRFQYMLINMVLDIHKF